MNYFEELIGEYFEEIGYFLQKNIRYGRNNEADLFGVNPKTMKMIHVEITERRATWNEFINYIEKKFDNKFTDKLYKEKFGTSRNIKKIYVVFWYHSDNNYKKKQELEEKFNIQIISFEDIFTYFKNRYPDKLGDTRKINHLIDLYFAFQEGGEKN